MEICSAICVTRHVHVLWRLVFECPLPFEYPSCAPREHGGLASRLYILSNIIIIFLFLYFTAHIVRTYSVRWRGLAEECSALYCEVSIDNRTAGPRIHPP